MEKLKLRFETKLKSLYETMHKCELADLYKTYVRDTYTDWDKKYYVDGLVHSEMLCLKLWSKTELLSKLDMVETELSKRLK